MPKTPSIENFRIAEVRYTNDSELRSQTMKISGLASRISNIANNLMQQAQASGGQAAKEARKMIKQLKVLSKQVNDDLIVPLQAAKQSIANSRQLATNLTQSREFPLAAAKLYESSQLIEKLREKYESVKLPAAKQLSDSVALLDVSKQAEIVEALEALAQFEDTMELVRFFSLQSWKLKLFLNDITSRLDRSLGEAVTQDQVHELSKCIRTMSNLVEELTQLTTNFENRQVGNLKIPDLYKSAETNHANACKTLKSGKTDNSKLLIALAARHQLGDEVQQDITRLQDLNLRFNQQFEDTATWLAQLEEEYSEAAAITLAKEEALQAEKKNAKAKSASTQVKSPDQKPVSSEVTSTRPITPPATSRSEMAATTTCVKELAGELLRQGHARIDWIKQDVKELIQSHHDTKREVAQTAQFQLGRLESQLERINSKSTIEDIQSIQSILDKELEELSTLLEQANLLSARSSPVQTPSSASISESEPKSEVVAESPRPDSAKTIVSSTGTLEVDTPEPANSVNSSLTAQTIEPANQIILRPTAQRALVPAQQSPQVSRPTLSWLLPATINHLNATQARLDYIASKQQALKLQLLQMNQPLHPAWQHLTPAIQELETMRTTLLYADHLFSPNRHELAQLPLVEMLRLIQVESHNPSFDVANAIGFLNETAHWLNAFQFNFDRSENHTDLASFWAQANQPH